MGHGPARVLVVDADRRVSAAVRRSLPKGKAFRVETATHAEQAFEKLDHADSSYNVAVISETLPERPGSAPADIGFELLAEFKARSPSTEIVFLVTNGNGSAVSALRAGACHYVEKPLSSSEGVGILVERAAQLRALKDIADDVAKRPAHDFPLVVPPVDAALVTESAEKLARLEKLSHATREIMADLSNTSLDDRLTAIARHATLILNAETCGVFLVKSKGFLTLEASFGHKSDGFKKGLELAIRAGRRTGLTGHIAWGRELFNAHGRDLKKHPAVQRNTDDHTPSGKCHSLLAIPLLLRQRVPDADRVADIVGLLRVDNKLDHAGLPRPELTFSKDDEWILEIFAEEVVVAIESAKLVDQLKEEKNYKDWLIDSSPNCIITIDTHGEVIEFNAQAAAILGYEATEARGMSVRHFYFDPETPKSIGAELDKRDGILTGYPTLLRHRNGHPIPTRLWATWLRDAQGDRIGSAGFFADVRARQQLEKLRDLLLQASKLVVEAGELRKGLQQLAEMMLGLLPHTFCRILLTQQNGTSLIVEAAHIMAETGESRSWQPGLKTEIVPEEWTGLRGILVRGEPTVVRLDERREPLERLSQVLGLTRPIQSLLLVPLKIGDRISGLLEVGELRGEEEHPITASEGDLAVGIAAHTAVLIDQMRLHQVTEDRNRELVLLQEATEAIAEAEPVDLLHAIAVNAARALEADFSLVWSYDQARGRLGTFISEGLASESVPGAVLRAFRQDETMRGRMGRAILKFGWNGVTDVKTERVPFLRRQGRDLLIQAGIRGLEAVALKAGPEPVGILYVAYRAARRFGDEDKSRLERFASYAALALKRGRLFTQVTRAQKLAEGLADVMVAGEPESTLQAVTESTRAGVDCDIVTLYPYDATSGTLTQPPKEDGLRHSKRIFQGGYDVTSSPIVQLLLSGTEPVLVEDTQQDQRTNDSPFTRIEKIHSFIAVPLRAGGTPLGVMFVSYRSAHRFTDAELNSIKLFSNQAAIAIQNAQRHEMTTRHKDELEALHGAATAMSSALALGNVRQAIVEQAHEMFGTVCCVLWPFDKARNEFLIGGVAAVGLSRKDIARARLLRPEPGRSRHKALEQLWICEEDVSRADLRYLSEPGRDFMQRAGIRSFQGIALRVGDEPLGVLFVAYAHPQEFTAQERNRLENFATYAALSLTKARLLDQVQRAEQIAKIIAKMSTAGEPASALMEVATLTPEVARCDIVRLYVRDHENGEFTCHRLRKARGNRTLTLASEAVRDGTALAHILDRGQRVLHDRTARPPADCGWPADQLKGLAAWVAIPMLATGQPVGIFFVGYREPQHFLDDEINSIDLLAHQTAIAVANNQLYEQARKRSDALRALYNAGRAIAQSSLRLDETLDEIAAQALKIVGRQRNEKGVFTYVALLAGPEFRLISAHPPQRRGELRQKIAGTGWSRGVQPGVAGRAVREGHSINVPDVAKDTDYLPLDAKVRSQLTVPISFEKEVIGFIGIEKRRLDAFSAEDLQNVELLAAQAAVAIQNARQYSELQKTQGLVGTRTALAWMGMMAASWRHDIESDALAIRGQAKLLRRRETATDRIEKLEMIERLANKICQRPITPPLGSSEDVKSRQLNGMVRDWVKLLGAHDEFRKIDLEMLPGLSDGATVLANAQWLRRAFDYLLSNATQAVAGSRQGRITVTTRRENANAVVAICDNGPGIPPEVQDALFREPIEKRGAEKGLGVGLLLAQVIAQTYQGDVACADTGPEGTTMVLSVPLEEKPDKEDSPCR